MISHHKKKKKQVTFKIVEPKKWHKLIHLGGKIILCYLFFFFFFFKYCIVDCNTAQPFNPAIIVIVKHLSSKYRLYSKISFLWVIS